MKLDKAQFVVAVLVLIAYLFNFMQVGGPVAFLKPEVALAAVAGSGDKSSPSFVVTIRTYFPETWIWQLAQVGLVKHLAINQ